MMQALTTVLLCSITHAFNPVISRRALSPVQHSRASPLLAASEKNNGEKPKTKAKAKTAKAKSPKKSEKHVAAPAKATAKKKAPTAAAVQTVDQEAEDDEADQPLSSLDDDDDEKGGLDSYVKEPWFNEGPSGDDSPPQLDEEREEVSVVLGADGAATPSGSSWGPRAALQELQASKIDVPGVNPFGFYEDKRGATIPQKKMQPVPSYSGDPFFQAAPTPPGGSAPSADEEAAVEASAAEATAAAAAEDYQRQWKPRAEFEALRTNKGMPNNNDFGFYQVDPKTFMTPKRQRAVASYAGDPFFQASPAAAMTPSASSAAAAAAAAASAEAAAQAAVEAEESAVAARKVGELEQPKQIIDDGEPGAGESTWRPRAQVNDLQANKIAVPSVNPAGFHEDKVGGGFVHHAKKKPALSTYSGDPFFQAAPTPPAAARNPPPHDNNSDGVKEVQ